MKARAGKITFCDKHKRHSKTLRKERMLKQDENALKIYLIEGILLEILRNKRELDLEQAI